MSSAAPTLADVVAALDRRYPPSTAEAWDAVGLVAGDPAQPVRRVLFAVDPVAAVADEAIAWRADLLVTHHPLLLRPVHSVAATTFKGALLHRLIRSGVALHVAHTNADAAAGGVAEALADAVGLVGTEPLVPHPGEPLDKHVVFVPVADAERLVDALAAAGAGAIGRYARCAWTTTGEGTFTPGPGARPVIGAVGEAAVVPEARVEMVAPRRSRAAVVAAMRAAHPYEEPAFDAYLTADLRHHPASELRERADHEAASRAGGAGGGDSAGTGPATAGLATPGLPALVDVAHFASEWPWLARAAADLAADLAAAGTTVETRVSTRSTDPWTARLASPDTAPHDPSEGPHL